MAQLKAQDGWAVAEEGYDDKIIPEECEVWTTTKKEFKDAKTLSSFLNQTIFIKKMIWFKFVKSN